jgi:hypothetical protein
VIPPVEYEHLLGRSFLFGVRDCFEHGRDFSTNFGIEITSYARPARLELGQHRPDPKALRA